MYPLIFATPDLEKHFRATIRGTEKEIGGWLFVDLGTVKPHDRRVLKPLLGLTETIGFVTSWVIVPNESRKPQTQWLSSLDYGKLATAMRATASSLTSHWTFHFHSHPGAWYVNPSQNDVLFWLDHCVEIDGRTEKIATGVIANRDGDLTGFEVTLHKDINRYALVRREGYSWRDRRLRTYRKEVLGR